ncbi:hypothetical protein ACFX5K_06085 [Rickettsiales bacterium LUAb2]
MISKTENNQNKKQRVISIDNNLHEKLEKLAMSLELPVSNLLKIANKVNVRAVKPEQFNNKVRVIYYSNEAFMKHLINYKIMRFLEVYEDYFS